MIAKLTIAALAAGLLATGGASTALASPTAAAMPALSAFATPLDRDHDNRGWDGADRRDNDHGRGWDGDRRRDDNWDGHDWHWWHDWGISPELCRDGGGHVQWDQHRCEGGRFDDFHVR
jgi:hypothetical protein